MPDTKSAEVTTGKDIVYVSWGGTGRAASLRTAMAQAKEKNAELVVLAILDPDAFSDLDESFGQLVSHELDWLLNVQVDLARTQIGADDIDVRVVVRRGDVMAEVVEVSKSCGAGTVLVGAPVPVSTHETVDSLLADLTKRLQCTVELIAP